MVRRFVFWLKVWCDLYLYGRVLVPQGVCLVCGQPILPGQLASGKVHVDCLPRFLKRHKRSV